MKSYKVLAITLAALVVVSFFIGFGSGMAWRGSHPKIEAVE